MIYISKTGLKLAIRLTDLQWKYIRKTAVIFIHVEKEKSNNKETKNCLAF